MTTSAEGQILPNGVIDSLRLILASSCVRRAGPVWLLTFLASALPGRLLQLFQLFISQLATYLCGLRQMLIMRHQTS